MENEVKNINKGLASHIREQRQDFDKVFEKLDCLDKKFASKWVEKVSIGILISLLGAVTFAIIQVI